MSVGRGGNSALSFGERFGKFSVSVADQRYYDDLGRRDARFAKAIGSLRYDQDPRSLGEDRWPWRGCRPETEVVSAAASSIEGATLHFRKRAA